MMTIKKKITITLLLQIMVILISIICIKQTYAASMVANGKCGENITWKLDNAGVLTLEGSGYTYENLTESPWKEYQNQVKSVVMKGTFEQIPNKAFYKNTNIKNITMLDTITVLGENSFEGCSNLKTIKFSKNIGYVYKEAFKNCVSLENIEIPVGTIRINENAFLGCNSLKSIIIKGKGTIIANAENTLGTTNTLICGQTNSDAAIYARYNNRRFKDINTGKITKYKITEQSYLETLPTKNVKALGVVSHGTTMYGEDKFYGYQMDFCNEKDKNNVTYQKIQSKVDELTKGCKTQREKAEKICEFVTSYMEYQYFYICFASIDSIYNTYNTRKGSCEGYSMLTAYMLYLADISTATATGEGHEWLVAYLDGKWTYIEPQAGIEEGNGSNRTEIISFAYEDYIYTIADPMEGPYISGIAKLSSEIEKMKTYTMPNSTYAKGIYSIIFPDGIQLKATKGTIGEKYIKEVSEDCYYYNNNQIVSTREHGEWKSRIVKRILPTATQEGSYVEELVCTRCNKVIQDTLHNTRLGDINEDGKINTRDARIILLVYIGKEELTENQRTLADVNGDGKINTKDARQILLKYIGEIKHF